jgi:hypothetical protein
MNPNKLQDLDVPLKKFPMETVMNNFTEDVARGDRATAVDSSKATGDG